MKTRNGFVSNSSSSSFIITGSVPSNFRYEYIELKNAKTKKEIIKDLKDNDIDGSMPMYLTTFVSDCVDDWRVFQLDYCVYRDGGHGYPRDEDDYDEIADRVWILKEHNYENTKWVCIKQFIIFVRNLKRRFYRR